ncbi:MAG: 3-dehydroquinate synthase [Bacteroidales bacterium]|nr:3-dehydroquinate synthase [Bacteroidales bacterium]
MDLYRIITGAGPCDLAALLAGEKEVFVVYDRAVSGVFEVVRRVLGERFKGEYVLEASEGTKNIDTVMAIERAMMEAGVSRGGLVLSMGGGITTDIGGFAACIYKRGVRFANVPTTLLAMVDAAIGGKTGVNLDGYKNMVGLIHQPEFVYIDPSFLKTLPEREIRCGLAELLKTFLLADAALFEEAVAALPEVLPEHILAAGRIKAQIVEEDPFEHGRRTILNLGHTFAHAIEKLSAADASVANVPVDAPGSRVSVVAAPVTSPAAPSGTSLATPPATSAATLSASIPGGAPAGPIPHGEAVAIGIVLACRLSDRLGVSEDGALEARVRSAFLKAGLPVESPYSVRELSAAMAKDKKAAGDGAVTFVLLAAPGRPVLRSLPLAALQ